MENEYVKKLTGKNPQDFEFAAAHIINNSDVKAFSALVEKSDFLFDFIKENVKKRLKKVITHDNYKNLLSFLSLYSIDYEEVIISSLVKYADEDLTDEMLASLENGTNDEKAYAAKYFSYINDTLAIEFLRENAYSDFDSLAINCAEALSAMGDRESYEEAISKIKSDDEFEQLSAVKFLVAYKDKNALGEIFKVLKTSSMPENIACEVQYIQSFIELLDSSYREDSIYALNQIINGLGEIVSLSQVFDFELYEVIEKLIQGDNYSKKAVFLLNAKLKFDQLTENDEYLFDEDKAVKEEVYAIKDLLNSQPHDFWETQKKEFVFELDSQSPFVFSALEIVQEMNLSESFEKLNTLLESSNQTLILKTVEVIKSLDQLSQIDKNTVFEKISDENIKAILDSLF